MTLSRPTRDILEEALVADPNDLATHSAYADLLIEEGDPRGEFIHTQLRLENPDLPTKERNALKRREKALLKAHVADWLGPLHDFFRIPRNVVYEFQRGWLHHVTIFRLSVAFARVLREAPQTRLLQFLLNIDSESESEGDYPAGDDVPADDPFPSLHAMRGAPYLMNVRYLQLGSPIVLDSQDNCGHGTGDALVALLPSLPKLEWLVSDAFSLNVAELFEYSMPPTLHSLEIARGFRYDLSLLLENRSFKSLCRLVLQPGGVGERSSRLVNPQHVERLFNSRHFPNLTEFALRGDRLGDEICQAIVGGKRMKSLKLLDLSGNHITDVGAAILAGSKHFPNIPTVILDHNHLSPAGIARLKHVHPGVQCDRQDSPTSARLDDDSLNESDLYDEETE